MKNPYRQFLQVPLRTTVFVTMAPLFVAKAAVIVLFVNDPQSMPFPLQSAAPVAAVAATGVADLLVMYYLTAGWYDLDRRPWVILFSPLLNFLIGAGVAWLAANMVMETHPLGRMQMLGAGLAGVVLILGLWQLIASIMLSSRVRPRRSRK